MDHDLDLLNLLTTAGFLTPTGTSPTGGRAGAPSAGASPAAADEPPRVAATPPPAAEAPAEPARGRAAKKGKKTHTRHSDVERARRERINGLIDQLRDLVPTPPSTAAAALTAPGGRRAKHAVLSDAIARLKELSSSAGGGGGAGGSGQTTITPPPPPADASLPPDAALPTVSVRAVDGGLYVRVAAADRPALLRDLAAALAALGVGVSRAAVVTDPARGTAVDVFHVVPAPPGARLPATDELTAALTAAAVGWGDDDQGKRGKRARASDG